MVFCPIGASLGQGGPGSACLPSLTGKPDYRVWWLSGAETTKLPGGAETTKIPGGTGTTKLPGEAETTKLPGGVETIRVPCSQATPETIWLCPGGQAEPGQPDINQARIPDPSDLFSFSIPVF